MIHAEIVASAGNRNVTEWCKKDDCWAEIGALNLPLLSPPPPEFRDAVLASRQFSDSEDRGESEDDLIAECVDLDGAAWARIMAWAAASPVVDDYDRKVVHTLSGYAMNGWIKPPSSKQAVRGSRVLNAARSAGVAI